MRYSDKDNKIMESRRYKHRIAYRLGIANNDYLIKSERLFPLIEFASNKLDEAGQINTLKICRQLQMLGM